MLPSLPSTIDDALDTLYEPNAVFSQFLAYASMTLFSLFLSLLPLLVFVFSCFPCLFFPFLSFFVFRFLAFSFLSSILFSFLCFFFQLTCVSSASSMAPGERRQHGEQVRAVSRYLVTAIGRRTNFKTMMAKPRLQSLGHGAPPPPFPPAA